MGGGGCPGRAFGKGRWRYGGAQAVSRATKMSAASANPRVIRACALVISRSRYNRARRASYAATLSPFSCGGGGGIVQAEAGSETATAHSAISPATFIILMPPRASPSLRRCRVSRPPRTPTRKKPADRSAGSRLVSRGERLKEPRTAPPRPCRRRRTSSRRRTSHRDACLRSARGRCSGRRSCHRGGRSRSSRH